ncbi:MAG: hypothetical protein MJ041_03185 [Acidaminococcaceae bacterium]|nr:hypothetical protein [Acidaminococcaceae bacterium]
MLSRTAISKEDGNAIRMKLWPELCDGISKGKGDVKRGYGVAGENIDSEGKIL